MFAVGMKNVNASIITIGDELLIGQTIDTNSAYIAKALNEIGIWVKKKNCHWRPNAGYYPGN
ncbi:MAG: hypothetical protein H0U44_08150 [Flavisolibacter sp.]|nr:hypothetical protein [Flavisolibacter sp.]